MGNNTFTVTRSAAIDAPAERIYPHLADFHAWAAWSPWEEVDPHLQRTYSGAETGAGARYAWSGNRQAGQGSMEIVRADEPRSLDIDLVFEKPFRSRNETRFTLDDAGDGRTDVTWTMTGPLTRMTRLMGIFVSMDKLVGKDFEKGLERLRTLTERDSAGA